MDLTHSATLYDVGVALFVALNTAILAWSTWNATQQRTRIERKVDEARDVATERHNGHANDDSVSPRAEG